MHQTLIVSIGDFLIARAVKETALSRGILDDTREKNEYFREKAAAKIHAYYELELEVIKHYVEMKIYYPHCAAALEEQKPYLLHMWNEAEQEYIVLRDQAQ